MEEKVNSEEKNILMKVMNFLGELLKEAKTQKEVEEIEAILGILLSLAKTDKRKKLEIKPEKGKIPEKGKMIKKKKNLLTEKEEKVILEIFASDGQRTLSKIAEILGLPSGTAYFAFENSLRKIKELYKEGVFPDSKVGELLKEFPSFEGFLDAVKEKISYKKLEFFR